MTTADWAITISLASLALSIAGFIWNVWSKFIYPKARLRVGISNRIAFGEGWDHNPESICLSVVNHGPGEVTLDNTVARPRRRWLGL
ncbi:hypothetical protein [uncultured Roseobacter sp.]|uniref:hypothetical protein n=1 Tax=uncultured Roseobacter sp. TaxID=114847 RepID=UPI002635A753|nr:hypothetical protein [uncultured Roseobacter sp.]